MSPHPTHSPKRSVFAGQSLMADSVGETAMGTSTIRGPQIAADSAGLTQCADVVLKHITVVPLGNTTATANSVMLFRAPSSGAKLKNVYICPGSTQNHSTTESDCWILGTYRYSATAKVGISKNVASLSGQTLAATSYKSIPVNGGYSTLASGDRLRLEATISGTPAAWQWAVAQIEWAPLNNA